MNLRSVPLQSYEEVGAAVSSLKNSENNSIIDRGWSINVEDLKRHFETCSSLISSKLNPHLLFWNDLPMPDKPMNTVNKLMEHSFVSVIIIMCTLHI